METKKFDFFQKSSKLTKLNFVRTPRKEIALGSSIAVLHKLLIRQRKGLHEYYNMGTKNLVLFQKSSKLNLTCMYFDLCWRAEINIQVGLNMHLYDDIGDASSSLWGSTSSSIFIRHWKYLLSLLNNQIRYDCIFLVTIFVVKYNSLFSHWFWFLLARNLLLFRGFQLCFCHSN